MTATTIFSVLGVAILVFVVMNRRAAKNVAAAVKAQVGEVGRWAKEADPLALYKETIDDGLESIEEAKRTLQKCRANITSLERQVNSGNQEKTRLENRIKSVLANGDPNNTAKSLALDLERVETNLATNSNQLHTEKEMYTSFLKRIERNQEKVNEARRKATDLGLKLEQSEREKEMRQNCSEFVKKNSFDAAGKLQEAEDAIYRKIDQNNSVGQVELDLSAHGEEDDADLEAQSRADEILARFKTPASV